MSRSSPFTSSSWRSGHKLLEFHFVGNFRDLKCQKNSVRLAHSSLSGEKSVTIKKRNPVNPLVEFQRNVYEIPFMEANSLCRAMVESSKSGYLKKHVWNKYISRAKDLKDKLSIKNISIIMLSSAKANIKDPEFYEQMCERIVNKCQLYIRTVQDASGQNVTKDAKIEFSAFNVYGILTACNLVKYKDEGLYQNLWQVTKYNLRHFLRSLDLLMEQYQDKLEFDDFNFINHENRFTFEDIAGILNAYASASIVIPDMLEMFAESFKKLYVITGAVDCKMIEKIPHITDITPKSFSITVHSLVRLGYTSLDIYNIGLSYMLATLDSMTHARDVTMLFTALVKLRCTEFCTKLPLEDDKELIELTNNVLEKCRHIVLDATCISSISSTMIILLSSNVFPPQDREHYRSSFGILFLDSVKYLIAEQEVVDKKILVQILKNSTILPSKQAALLLLSSTELKHIGLVSTPFDVSQYFCYLSDLYSSCSGRVACFIENHAILAAKQYTQRLTYVLSPNLLGLSKTKSRPPDLYNIIKLESRRHLGVQEEDEEINVDWEYLNKSLMEYNIDNFNTLATILGSCTKFRPSKHLSNFCRVSLDYFSKLFKYNDRSQFKTISIEAISAVVHALSKFRLKNIDIMQQIANVIISKLKSTDGESKGVNLMALNNIMMGFAKLDFPQNPLFNYKINRGQHHIDIPAMYKIKRIAKLNNDHAVFIEMFHLFSKVLNAKNIRRMNQQMITNCLYTLSIVGFDKFTKVTLATLLGRLIHFRKESSKFQLSTDVDVHDELAILNNLLPEKNFEGNSSLPKEENIAYGQIRILLLALEYFVRHLCTTRVIERYCKLIKRLYTSAPYGELNGSGNRKRKCTDSCIPRFRQNVIPRPSISGFHRNVLYILSQLNEGDLTIKSEVPWKNGTYFMDISVQRNKSVRYIEVNGPYHYYSQTLCLNSISKMKYFLISNHRKRIINVPYYEWIKCEDDEAKIDYLSKRIKSLSL